MSDNSEDISVNDNPFSGYSYSKVYSTYYTWKINDITKLIEFVHAQSRMYTTISPEFFTGAKNADPWYLELSIVPGHEYPSRWLPQNILGEIDNRKNERYGDKILITMKQKYLKFVRIKCKLFFLNHNNQQIEEISRSENRLASDWKEVITDKYGCNKTLSIISGILLDKSEEFLKNDTLTVGVELIVYDYLTVNKPTTPKGPKLKSISDDYKDLFLRKKRLKKDVIIKVGDKKFEAHKCVLITCSSFFEDKFLTNGEENNENEVEMSDIDPSVFEKVLKFIYTNKVDDLNGCAEKLLEAADKYDLQGLKKMCQEFIYKNITSENALEMMVTNDRQGNKELKEIAVEYVANNYPELKSTQEFLNLKKSYPSLYVELLEKIADIGNEDSEAEKNSQSS